MSQKVETRPQLGRAKSHGELFPGRSRTEY